MSNFAYVINLVTQKEYNFKSFVIYFQVV